MTNALAYQGYELITAVKRFTAQAQGSQLFGRDSNSFDQCYKTFFGAFNGAR
jgi:hypothetical protein